MWRAELLDDPAELVVNALQEGAQGTRSRPRQAVEQGACVIAGIEFGGYPP